MSVELNGVSPAQEDFEEPVLSPATHLCDPTRSPVGRSGIPVRLITLLSVTMAPGIAACTSEETPTEPSASASPELALVKTYTAVDLGTLGGCCSVAEGINSRGQVVGSSDVAGGEEDEEEGSRAFLWENGVMTDLGAGAFSRATAVNPAGTVVGSFGREENAIFAFKWEKGVIRRLSGLGGILDGAADINPAGEVVGFAQLGTGSHPIHAVLWDKQGVVTDLGTLDGGFSFARGINPAGQVVGTSGTRAFLWANGVMTDLGTLGGNLSSATDINPAGQVVGCSGRIDVAIQQHAFLWEKGVMTDLGTLGGVNSCAFGINPAGQVVGEAETAEGITHAVLWDHGVITDLGALPGAGRSGAFSINAAGDVVGFVERSSPGAFTRHATLWTRK
jgi:probable HAF family extracellular repeat protein